MKAIGWLAVPVLAFSASLASAQQTAGPIHACVYKTNGKLRIVASAAECKSKETHVAWNRDASPQLVGLTDSTHKGDEGALGFTQACQQQFPGTRFCTSDEVLRTTALPASLSGSAWVRFSGQELWNGGLTNASGMSNQPHMMTCEGWAVGAGSTTGLAVSFDDASGSFSLQLCSEPRKIACCGFAAD